MVFHKVIAAPSSRRAQRFALDVAPPPQLSSPSACGWTNARSRGCQTLDDERVAGGRTKRRAKKIVYFVSETDRRARGLGHEIVHRTGAHLNFGQDVQRARSRVLPRARGRPPRPGSSPRQHRRAGSTPPRGGRDARNETARRTRTRTVATIREYEPSRTTPPRGRANPRHRSDRSRTRRRTSRARSARAAARARGWSRRRRRRKTGRSDRERVGQSNVSPVRR